MASKPPFVGEKVKVSEVFDLQMGKTPSRKNLSYWNNGDYDWVSIKDLGSYDRFVGRTRETISELGRVESGIKPVPANTLLMSFKLSIGKTAITTRETYTNEAIMAFLDRGYYDFDLGYMWHQFRSKDWMVGTNVAVMGKTLNKQTLGNAIINLPVMSDQLMIARQLDEVHAQIDLTKNCLRMLDHLIKSRFVEMFGDPVNDPAWDSISLRDLCSKLGSGATPKGGKSSYKVSGIPLIRSMNVHNGRFEWKDLAYIDDKQAEKLKGVTLQKGDVLLNITGASVARSCILPDELEGGRVNQHVAIIRADRSLVLPGVLNEILINPSFQNLLLKDSRMAGATREAITKQDLQDLTIPLFPMSLQQQFADFVGQVDKSRFVCALASQRFTLAGVSFESGRHFHTWTPLRMIYVGG